MVNEINKKKRKIEVNTPLDYPGFCCEVKKKCLRISKKISWMQPVVKSPKIIRLGEKSNNSLKPPKSKYGNMKMVHKETCGNVDKNQQCLFLLPLPERSYLLGAFYDKEKEESELIKWSVQNTPQQNKQCTVSLTPDPNGSRWTAEGKIINVSVMDMVKNYLSIILISSNDSAHKNINMMMIPVMYSTLTPPMSMNALSSLIPQNASVSYDGKMGKAKGEEINTGWLKKVGFFVIQNDVVAFINEMSTTPSDELITIAIPNQTILGLNCDGENVIYVSTKQGNIYGYDLRNKSKASVFQMNVGVPIYQLEPLSSDQNLIANGHNNFLSYLDMRNRKIVHDYCNHDNASMRIRANVDERENVLSCAGESGVVRLWNLKDGQIIKEISAPENYTKEDFGSCWFPSETVSAAQITVAQRQAMIYQSYYL